MRKKRALIILLLISTAVLFTSCSLIGVKEKKPTGVFSGYLTPAEFYVVWDSSTPDVCYLLDHRDAEPHTSYGMTMFESILDTLSETFAQGSKTIEMDRGEYGDTKEYNDFLNRQEERARDVSKSPRLVVFGCSSNQYNNISNGILTLNNVKYVVYIADRWAVFDENDQWMFLGDVQGYNNLLIAWWEEYQGISMFDLHKCQISSIDGDYKGLYPVISHDSSSNH